MIFTRFSKLLLCSCTAAVECNDFQHQTKLNDSIFSCFLSPSFCHRFLLCLFWIRVTFANKYYYHPFICHCFEKERFHFSNRRYFCNIFHENEFLVALSVRTPMHILGVKSSKEVSGVNSFMEQGWENWSMAVISPVAVLRARTIEILTGCAVSEASRKDLIEWYT